MYWYLLELVIKGCLFQPGKGRREVPSLADGTLLALSVVSQRHVKPKRRHSPHTGLSRSHDTLRALHLEQPGFDLGNLFIVANDVYNRSNRRLRRRLSGDSSMANLLVHANKLEDKIALTKNQIPTTHPPAPPIFALSWISSGHTSLFGGPWHQFDIEGCSAQPSCIGIHESSIPKDGSRPR